MMSVTHAAIAITSCCIALGTADPAVLVAAAVGSQLPDLDTTNSTIGRVLYPIAAQIEKRFAHRTITHSFLATGLVAIAFSPLGIFHWHYWAAVVLGHFMGWFSDAFTKSGVTAFYPNPAKLVIPGNPKVRLSTHSVTEYWLLGIVCLLLVVSVNLIGAGGISEQFAIAFFNDTNTAADQFHKHGSSRIIGVEVDGLHTITGQRMQGSFTVIEATAGDIIAEQAGKLYKIGHAPDVQIRPTSVKIHLGETIRVQAKEQALKEIAIEDWLRRVPQNSYVSGSLVVDDMREVRIPAALEEFPSIKIFGGQIELANAKPSQVSALLRESWVLSGSVVIKTRS